MSSGKSNPNGARANRYRLMMEAGRDNEYIARRMGVDENTVERWRYRLRNVSVVRDPEARNRIFKSLFEQGKTNEEISRIMGIHPRSVGRRRLKIYGPSRRNYYDLDLAEVGRVYDQTGSIRAVGRHFEIPDSAAESAITRARNAGLCTRKPHPNRPYTEEELKRAEHMLKVEKMSYRMVATELGRKDYKRLSRTFPGLGWTPSQAQHYRWMQQKLDNL